MLIPMLALQLACCVRYVPTPAVRRSTVDQAFDRHIRNAIDAGEGDVRLSALRQRVAANPVDIESRLELAKAYAAAGFPDVALEHYRVGSSRFPNSAEMAVELAKALRSLKLPEEAKLSLEDFVARNPSAPADALSWLAILQDEAGDYSSAEKNHRAALDKRPSSDSLHNNLGYNLLLQSKHEQAAVEFRRALDIAPSSSVARNNLGLATASEPKDAVLHWQSVSDPATAHNNMAAVLIEKGNYAEARRELELALRYRNDHEAALKNLNLVAQLDGGGMEMRFPAANAFWRRFLHILVGETAP